MLELREHYETLQERREYTIRVLNSVKSSTRMRVLGSASVEHTLNEQLIELCRTLQKLYFQVMLMCQSWDAVIQHYAERHTDNVVRFHSFKSAVKHVFLDFQHQRHTLRTERRPYVCFK